MFSLAATLAQEPTPASPGDRKGGKKAGAAAGVTKDGKPADAKPGPATPEMLKSEVVAPPEFDVTARWKTSGVTICRPKASFASDT